jgi:hypothetical protein
MKKFFMMALVAGAAFMMACGGVESKAEDFAKKLAEAAGDPAKIEAIQAEIEEYTKDLSEEDKKAFDAIIDAADAASDLAGMASQFE